MQTLTILDLRSNKITSRGAADLAETLKSNTVGSLIYFFVLHSFHSIKQTLSTLFLNSNKITSTGVLSLMIALRLNTVRSVVELLRELVCSFLSKTLVKIEMGRRKIGQQWRQSLYDLSRYPEVWILESCSVPHCLNYLCKDGARYHSERETAWWYRRKTNENSNEQKHCENNYLIISLKYRPFGHSRQRHR